MTPSSFTGSEKAPFLVSWPRRKDLLSGRPRTVGDQAPNVGSILPAVLEWPRQKRVTGSLSPSGRTANSGARTRSSGRRAVCHGFRGQASIVVHVLPPSLVLWSVTRPGVVV